jgi:primary-amine oxidase
MSLEQIPVPLPFVGGKKSFPQHPLGPLTAPEITETARLIKGLWPTNTNIQFKHITLREPKKADLTPFLAAEHAGQRLPAVERRAFVVYYIRNTVGDPNGKSSETQLISLIGQTSRGNSQLELGQG